MPLPVDARLQPQDEPIVFDAFADVEQLIDRLPKTAQQRQIKTAMKKLENLLFPGLPDDAEDIKAIWEKELQDQYDWINS